MHCQMDGYENAFEINGMYQTIGLTAGYKKPK
jgi:hypothetical protein